MATAQTTHTHTGRSTAQLVAMVFGIVFIVVALLGFFTSGMSMDADPATAPKLLGIFPVNLLHNLVHLLFGVWGVMAARSHPASRSYCIGAGAIYALLAVLGWFVPNGFGLVPIGGADVWLHVLLAAVLLAVGLTASPAVDTVTTTRA